MDRRKFLSFLAAAPALPVLGTAAAQAYPDWKLPTEWPSGGPGLFTDAYETIVSDNAILAEIALRNVMTKNLLYGHLVENEFEGLHARSYHEPT